MTRIVAGTGLIILAATGAFGQAPAALPLKFEVASVKVFPMAPNSIMLRQDGQEAPVVRATGNRLTERVHLEDLVMQAYGVHDYQISGLPDWGKSPVGTVYEIEAKAEGDGTPTTEQLRQMLQSLLADRFQLRLHHVTKDVPVYALVIGKGGLKMRELRADEEIPTFRTRPPETATPKGTFSEIFSLLSHALDRPLVDETGLTGRYEYASWDWAQIGRTRREDPMVAQDWIFAAAQEQLGLKMEPRIKSMETLAIEHVETPSPN